jgi:hypothetical protein
MAGPERLLLPVSHTELKTQYLALQQDADFALWRAREGNLDVRQVYEAHLKGSGEPPSATQLAELEQLEITAEARYRDLREFLRHHFEHLDVAPA